MKEKVGREYAFGFITDFKNYIINHSDTSGHSNNIIIKFFASAFLLSVLWEI